MTLKQLQSDFLASISSPETLNSTTNKPCFTDHLCQQGNITTGQRLSIYQNAYRARLCSVIDSDFPYLGRLIGDDLYHPLCHAYIAAFPSHNPSLNNFCAQLPTFIRQYTPLKEHTIVTELCDFEWQLRTSFDAKDSKALSVDYLQTIPNDQWPSLTFKFTHGFALKYYSMNTVEVWKALSKDEQPEITTLEVPQAWVIWRQGLITQYISVSVDEAYLLEAAQEGQSFEDLCEILLEWWPEERVPERAFHLLQHWLQLGLLRPIS